MTKPIELGVKKTEVPTPPTKKNSPAKSRKEFSGAADQQPEVPIMALIPARARKTGPQPEIFDQIGQRLRNVYNDVLTQSVPERFLDLLQTLEGSAQGETESKSETLGKQNESTATRKKRT